jgi:hypothetical protein
MESKQKNKPKIGRPVKLATGVARVVHVALSDEQDAWITAEWHRRGLQTRVDAIRAVLDEMRKLR